MADITNRIEKELLHLGADIVVFKLAIDKFIPIIIKYGIDKAILESRYPQTSE